MGFQGRSECRGERVGSIWLGPTRYAVQRLAGIPRFSLRFDFEKTNRASRRLPVPFRAFHPNHPRRCSARLAWLAPDHANFEATALLSVLLLFSACSWWAPDIPTAEAAWCGREVPRSRREPAHDVSTPSASRFVAVVGTTWTEAPVDAAQAGACEAEPNTCAEFATPGRTRRPDPATPLSTPPHRSPRRFPDSGRSGTTALPAPSGLFHPDNALELPPSGLRAARRSGPRLRESFLPCR
jgi:hypothetical protein